MYTNYYANKEYIVIGYSHCNNDESMRIEMLIIFTFFSGCYYYFIIIIFGVGWGEMGWVGERAGLGLGERWIES